MTNATSYTLPQLKQLRTRIAKEIAKREVAAKALLLQRLRQLAREEGIDFEDLFSAGNAKSAKATLPAKVPMASLNQDKLTKTQPLPPKYRNPNNLAQAWSGRGRKPAWFEAWIQNGGSLDALRNAATLQAGRGARAVVPPVNTLAAEET